MSTIEAAKEMTPPPAPVSVWQVVAGTTIEGEPLEWINHSGSSTPLRITSASGNGPGAGCRG
jgi:hypothetical protein